MATSVHETIELTLDDGRVLKMRPLKIKLLRDFLKTFARIEAVQADNEASMDVLVDCVEIAMKQYSPDLSEDRELLETTLDLPDIYLVIEAASGMKFDDEGNVAATGIRGQN